jgi:hypothetical protein
VRRCWRVQVAETASSSVVLLNPLSGGLGADFLSGVAIGIALALIDEAGALIAKSGRDKAFR